MTYELFEVGGAVRDELLGLKSKDIDYSVVLKSKEGSWTVEEGFNWLSNQLKIDGYEIFLETPDCYTIRAKFPKYHKHQGVADFVLSRKEVGYFKGTRRPILELGTLEDDMIRRDYKVNALAKNSEGNIIDLFGGISDLNLKTLDTPSDPNTSFMDDPLRIIRGMRFCITKGFTFSERVRMAIRQIGIQGIEVVSKERMREEMLKCFQYDTITTLKYLNFMEDELRFPIRSYIFAGNEIWLKPTTEK